MVDACFKVGGGEGIRGRGGGDHPLRMGAFDNVLVGGKLAVQRQHFDERKKERKR